MGTEKEIIKTPKINHIPHLAALSTLGSTLNGGAKNKAKEAEKSAAKEVKVISSQTIKTSAPKAVEAEVAKKPLKTEKKKEEVKNPEIEVIKKPMSAFMLYCNANRKQVQSENPRKSTNTPLSPTV